jgi:hypothetical protein
MIGNHDAPIVIEFRSYFEIVPAGEWFNCKLSHTGCISASISQWVRWTNDRYDRFRKCFVEFILHLPQVWPEFNSARMTLISHVWNRNYLVHLFQSLYCLMRVTVLVRHLTSCYFSPWVSCMNIPGHFFHSFELLQQVHSPFIRVTLISSPSFNIQRVVSTSVHFIAHEFNSGLWTARMCRTGPRYFAHLKSRHINQLVSTCISKLNRIACNFSLHLESKSD